MELPKVDLSNPTYEGFTVAYGLAPILNTIVDVCKSRVTPKWSLFLINVETMIRNREQAGSTENEILRGAMNDCLVLSRYIAAMVGECHMNASIKPVVCFYSANYLAIDKTYLREKFPIGTENRWRLKEEFVKMWNAEWNVTFDEIDILMSYQPPSDIHWVSKSLITDIDSIAHSTPCRFREAVMISHQAVDYHVMRRVGKFNLLESYTGKFKKPSDIGEKLFGDKMVPFNPYTHVLFGDKTVLKALAIPKVKRMLKEQAIREQWLRLSDTAVLSILSSEHVVPLKILTAPKNLT